MLRIFGKGPRASLDWRVLQVEATDSHDSGPCPECGDMSRRVWALVHSPRATLAAYFVEWTLGKPEHDAHFDLAIGKWGEQATPGDRQAVSLIYHIKLGQGAFMVTDAASRPIAGSGLVGAALRRDQIVGQPIATEVFAIADAILAKDARLEEIRHWS